MRWHILHNAPCELVVNGLQVDFKKPTMVQPLVCGSPWAANTASCKPAATATKRHKPRKCAIAKRIDDVPELGMHPLINNFVVLCGASPFFSASPLHMAEGE
eukprot:CAMPEP_0203889766 /NCGR_PEP_ID=MMETSP0359-20131031/33296_1 /ASSEMBLY_ACC=CAM_ASM_000338 /TAXON_ID=268821 /ORGANISM="Scrippsiella Hangoei, Strain SHTV-5" /LENGTH=101 /DNA_ID=CAMNT_0050811245 /DNA_START=165 /DNA_END=467 /DNA_ORIENTATION=-